MIFYYVVQIYTCTRNGFDSCHSSQGDILIITTGLPKLLSSHQYTSLLVLIILLIIKLWKLIRKLREAKEKHEIVYILNYEISHIV